MSETTKLLNAYCYHSKHFDVLTERVNSSKFTMLVIRNSDLTVVDTVTIEDVIEHDLEGNVIGHEYATDNLYEAFNDLKNKYIGHEAVTPCMNCKKRCSGCVVADTRIKNSL
jgi:Mg2+/Co2+ transporter CorC